jgi:hypothetical protein
VESPVFMNKIPQAAADAAVLLEPASVLEIA